MILKHYDTTGINTVLLCNMLPAVYSACQSGRATYSVMYSYGGIMPYHNAPRGRKSITRVRAEATLVARPTCTDKMAALLL